MPIMANAPKLRTQSLLTATTIALSCTLYGCLSFQPVNAFPPVIDVASLTGTGVTIYAAGDIAECGRKSAAHSDAAKTAALIDTQIANDATAQILTIGDNAYPVGVTAEFTNCYAPTWGRFKDRTRPASGNHEYYTPEAGGYRDYFGAAAGQAPGFYYSFDLGNWHLLSINSNLHGAVREAELAWLKKDLAQSKARCTLAYWHHPLFSSGGHGNNESMREFWQLLQAAHADVVLTGHDHDYERFAPQDADGTADIAHGIREFVVGTGGAYLTPFLFRKANSELANATTHGVLKMNLKDNGYEWEFLPVAGSKFTDHGVAFCH